MKLTWFSGTVMRIHIGGAIVVVDPENAPAGIDRTELVSGADHIVSHWGANLPVDLQTWRPRKPGRLLDEAVMLPAVNTWSAPGSLLIDAVGEAPLVLVSGPAPVLGPWASSAVIVLFGDGGQIAHLGQAMLQNHAPRLLVIAGDDAAADQAIARLHGALDGAGLVALEPRMALEI